MSDTSLEYIGSDSDFSDATILEECISEKSDESSLEYECFEGNFVFSDNIMSRE